MTFYSLMAETAASGSGDLLGSLGIDWRLLIIQIIAFSILVALLGKFVYPLLMKSIDERQKNIDDAQKASEEAQKAANKTKLAVEELLSEARQEASAIVATAKEEATDIVAASEEKARTSAERIAAEAKKELARDVETAKKALHNDTLELIALATEKVVGKSHAKNIDAGIIADSLKEIK